jgi:transposase-like protein
MGYILHSNAKTTIATRKEIQNSKESNAKLAKKYSLNIKTIIKWRKRSDVSDKLSGPIKPISVLSVTQQEIICEFRRVTKFSLDDCFICLRDKIPLLSRSNLYRCLKRNNLNILPKEESGKIIKKPFKEYQLGYFHIDITSILIKGQKLYLFVAIDRTSKYAYFELHEHQTKENSCLFLSNLLKDCPYKINKILTDNGAQFTYELLAIHLRPKDHIHSFDQICQDNNIEHRLTQFRHPWTNGQVEVFNRIIKNHTVKKYHYDDVKQLKDHLMSFLLVYNYQRPLKSLKFKTPYERVVEEYQINPDIFLENPSHKKVGLNSYL